MSLLLSKVTNSFLGCDEGPVPATVDAATEMLYRLKGWRSISFKDGSNDFNWMMPSDDEIFVV